MRKPTNRQTERLSSKTLLSVGAGLILLLAGVWFVAQDGKQPQQQRSDASPPTVSVLPPVLPTSEFLNVAPNVAYVGSDRCRDCHPGEHAAFQETAHSHSLSYVNPDSEPPDFAFDHAPSRKVYSVYRAAGKLHHRETIHLATNDDFVSADYPLKYLIGSGRHSRTYIAQSREFLVESPITWYASLNAWAMSPGYDAADHEAFHRVVGFDCLYCHAGNLETYPRSIERVTIHELAIGCERCHGPGELHVRHRTEQDSGDPRGGQTDFTIVNPARLSRELREAVCQQCHLESVVRVAGRGRSRGEFRPGLPWDAFYVNYSFQQQESMTVTGHVEQLRMSRCYTESSTLTCVTCHHPHERDGAEVARSHKACLQCHDVGDCSNSERSEATDSKSCIACHMPQAETDIPHIAFTHHRIGLHGSTNDTRKNKPEEFSLTPILKNIERSPVEIQRMLGLAYMQLFRTATTTHERQQYFGRASTYLGNVPASGAADSMVYSALAELAIAHGDTTTASQYASKALSQETTRAEAHLQSLELLAQIDLRQGRTPEAIQSLRKLTSLRLYPADWFLLGVCNQKLGNLDEAIACFERVIDLDGSHPEPFAARSAIQASKGNAEQATANAARAQQLQSRNSTPSR